ncbi:DsbE family thiol:disulfide interchange protein [Glaesserella parasuis]|uniref:DsbE family thiol:disulfide interchange protein n=1 Tax=Glaesserella parasuis TaxID=738 RepID=UPI00135D5E20|nr:DsbE family thiol:disulfide interchange protein [Glaesserella parasuis]MDG6858549.1 DsbE family thiol:disulfide interchange protein [Glaesserella parasuis]MDO9655625.1 DsbE family thiol:disulfide interchange protein [Glaesserella parasuis]MDO9658045.1 DsbE family thiol:disulfide interchange protein [Glaesserella parasuis]MDO9666275.1 DsbE family thiol:disulfide interchange protein [Glaesserella parasuis]MDO9737851.1 DsbE family thiol:disulfide interchange protein [Glaesserella parasuis]
MKAKLLIPLIVFLGLIITFTIQLQRNANGEDPKALESALVGKIIPEFKLESLHEATQMLDSSVVKTGTPRLLNVWATWCPTCFAEHQFLTVLAKQGVEIVGIDYKDERAKALKFLKDYGDPYKAIVYDPKGSLGLDLGVYGAPETFIIDGNGKIHYRHTGDVNEKVWNEVLKPMYEKLK